MKASVFITINNVNLKILRIRRITKLNSVNFWKLRDKFLVFRMKISSIVFNGLAAFLLLLHTAFGSQIAHGKAIFFFLSQNVGWFCITLVFHQKHNIGMQFGYLREECYPSYLPEECYPSWIPIDYSLDSMFVP